MANILMNDLKGILEQTAPLWEQLRGRRLFLTGGTGFFGSWLLESFLHINRALGLNASVVVLTRDAAAFRAKLPHLALDSAVSFHTGEIRTFVFPSGQFSHIIHAATPASAVLNADNPLTMLDTIIEGTRRVLEFSASCGARRFLLTSSGAVYGKQPSNLPHIKETWTCTPNTMSPDSAYAEGKRVAELLCAIYARQYGLETMIARCFAFVGPYLPLDAHFAAGNFVRDQLAGGPINVQGDGTTVRSYLYAADLMTWLWTILFRGEPCHPYNVGSDEAISIKDLAHTVADLVPGTRVQVAQEAAPGADADRYVPCVNRAKTELNLAQTVSLRDALARTSEWAREVRA